MNQHNPSTLAAWLRRLFGHTARQPATRNRRPRLELLETRDLPAAGLREQAMVEMVNRLRANPTAELTRMLADPAVNDAVNFFGVNRTALQQQFAALTPAAPLAYSDQIGTVALAHTNLMLQNDRQSHQFAGEAALLARLQAAGYGAGAATENAYAFASGVLLAEAGFAIDWGFGPNGVQNPASQRANLLSTDYTDIGLGIVDSTPGKKTGPLLVTQNFGSLANGSAPEVLGVVYRDANNNGVYDQGEGVAGATVTVTGPGTNVVGTRQTSAAGYYQIPASTGDFTVTVTGGGLAAPLTRQVSVVVNNVKADFTTNDTLTLQAGPYEVQEDAGTYQLNVIRSGDTSGSTTVTVTATEGTAKTPANYTLQTTTVAFAANETSRPITVTIVNKPGVFTGDLNFTLTLSNPTNGATLANPTSAVVTIKDKDIAPSDLRIENASYTVNEDVGTLRLRVLRTGNLNTPASVDVSAVPGTATTPANFTLQTPTLTFGIGDAEKTIDFAIVNVPGANGNAGFTVSLSNPGGNARLPAAPATTVTIVDLDTPPSQLTLDQATYTVNEDAGTLTLHVLRTGNTATPATVNVVVTPGTATTPANFTLQTPTVTFGANENSKTITIVIVNKPGVFSGNLDFTVTLQAPGGNGTLAVPSQAVVTIADLDPAPSDLALAAQPRAIKENGGTYRLQVTRTGNLAGTVSVTVTATPGTATTPANYTLLTPTLTFGPNDDTKEIAVSIVNVPGVNGNLDFTLTLTNPTGGGRLGGGQTATVTIQDVDVAPPVNQAPTAADDTFLINNNERSAAGTSVLTNDTPFNNLPMTAALVTAPAHGSVTLHTDGTFSYQPGANFQGIDNFTYQASNGRGNSAVAKVTILSQNALLVRKLYQQVLKRSAGDQEVIIWVGALNRGVLTVDGVASGIFESQERLDPIIQGYYQQYLKRTASQPELDVWRGVWQQDAGPNRLFTGIIASPEFYQSAGGTNEGWTKELYRRVLGREAVPAEVKLWVDALDGNQVTREQAVLGFTRGKENFYILVRGWYQQYLGRDATGAEVDSQVADMLNGQTERATQLKLIGGVEYRNKPAPPPQGVAQRL